MSSTSVEVSADLARRIRESRQRQGGNGEGTGGNSPSVFSDLVVLRRGETLAKKREDTGEDDKAAVAVEEASRQHQDTDSAAPAQAADGRGVEAEVGKEAEKDEEEDEGGERAQEVLQSSMPISTWEDIEDATFHLVKEGGDAEKGGEEDKRDGRDGPDADGKQDGRRDDDDDDDDDDYDHDADGEGNDGNDKEGLDGIGEEEEEEEEGGEGEEGKEDGEGGDAAVEAASSAIPCPPPPPSAEPVLLVNITAICARAGSGFQGDVDAMVERVKQRLDESFCDVVEELFHSGAGLHATSTTSAALVSRLEGLSRGHIYSVLPYPTELGGRKVKDMWAEVEIPSKHRSVEMIKRLLRCAARDLMWKHAMCLQLESIGDQLVQEKQAREIAAVEEELQKWRDSRRERLKRLIDSRDMFAQRIAQEEKTVLDKGEGGMGAMFQEEEFYEDYEDDDDADEEGGWGRRKEFSTRSSTTFGAGAGFLPAKAKPVNPVSRALMDQMERRIEQIDDLIAALEMEEAEDGFGYVGSDEDCVQDLQDGDEEEEGEEGGQARPHGADEAGEAIEAEAKVAGRKAKQKRDGAKSKKKKKKDGASSFTERLKEKRKQQQLEEAVTTTPDQQQQQQREELVIQQVEKKQEEEKEEEVERLDRSISLVDAVAAMVLSRYPREPGVSDTDHFHLMSGHHERIKREWLSEFGRLPAAHEFTG